ncbi:MuF-like minor capsid & VIP2-like ADP-ribosyltransferase toxin [Microbacterium phage Cicada]|nr:MuF-like minor capsid & VIP2-like ADP-ribosyltransferase toxin [Microbacterium phage Cicada]
MPVSPTPDESYYWEIAQAYQQAELQILGQIRDRLDKGQSLSDQQWATERLAEVQVLRRDATKVLAGVNQSMASKISGSFGNAYKDGEISALKDTAAYLPQKPSAVSSRARQNAVAAIARGNTQKIAGVLPGMLRQMEDDYKSVVKTAVKSVAAGGTNDRRKATAQALQQAYGKGLKTGPGGKMNLPDYVTMAVRTGTANAMIQGHLDTLGENGLDLVMIYPGPRHCDRCDAWANRPLYRTSGKAGVHLFDSAVSVKKVKVDVAGSLEEAKAAGWGHPNCRCNVGAFLPGVTPIQNPRPKWDEKGYEAQQNQRGMERKIREWKTREALAMDPAERKAAHNKVTSWQALLRSHLEANPFLKRKSINEQITGQTGPATVAKPKLTPPKAPQGPSKAQQIADLDQDLKTLQGKSELSYDQFIAEKHKLEAQKQKLIDSMTDSEIGKLATEPTPKPSAKPATNTTPPDSPFDVWLKGFIQDHPAWEGMGWHQKVLKGEWIEKHLLLTENYTKNLITWEEYNAGVDALGKSAPKVAAADPIPPKATSKPAPTGQTFEQWVNSAASSPKDFGGQAVVKNLKLAFEESDFKYVQDMYDFGYLSKTQLDAAKKAWGNSHPSPKPSPEPAKVSPVSPKPSPVPPDTPSHPYSWDGKAKPTAPKEPVMPSTPYKKIADEWINEAKAKYEAFAPGKKLENSNNWGYFSKVVDNKDAQALQYLLDNQYVDVAMVQKIRDAWATGDKLTPAQAKKYKADMDAYGQAQVKYKADLAAWKTANGITSSSKGFDGAIRWTTDQAGVDWANKNLKVASGDQRTAIQRYTGSAYSSWNESLRENNAKTPPTKGNYQKATRDADAAMAPTPADIIVHRGTTFHELSGTGANMPPPAPTSLIGKTYTNPGYMSTSVGRGAAFGGKPVQMEILVPEGYGTSWAMPYSNFASERELLLSRHSTLYIHDVYQDGGTWRVVAEIVPDGEDVSVWTPSPPKRP